MKQLKKDTQATAADMRKERLNRMVFDQGMELYAIPPGAINVKAVTTEDTKDLPLAALKPVVVRVGNSIMITDVEMEPIETAIPVKETIEISADDVEVFYVGGADPSDYGIIPQYTAIQIYDTEFRVISGEMKEFVRTVMF